MMSFSALFHKDYGFICTLDLLRHWLSSNYEPTKMLGQCSKSCFLCRADWKVLSWSWPMSGFSLAVQPESGGGFRFFFSRTTRNIYHQVFMLKKPPHSSSSSLLLWTLIEGGGGGGFSVKSPCWNLNQHYYLIICAWSKGLGFRGLT